MALGARRAELSSLVTVVVSAEDGHDRESGVEYRQSAPASLSRPSYCLILYPDALLPGERALIPRAVESNIIPYLGVFAYPICICYAK